VSDAQRIRPDARTSLAAFKAKPFTLSKIYSNGKVGPFFFDEKRYK
jgi:hypothetical protein